MINLVMQRKMKKKDTIVFSNVVLKLCILICLLKIFVKEVFNINKNVNSEKIEFKE